MIDLPYENLWNEARTAASMLKRAEMKEFDGLPSELIESRSLIIVHLAFVLKDNVIKVKMTWEAVRDLSEDTIAGFIAGYVIAAVIGRQAWN